MTQKELFHSGTRFQIGDLVTTIPNWYTTNPVRQGIITGFSYFEYRGESIPSVEIEFIDGVDKMHPDNIKKLDESLMEMC